MSSPQHSGTARTNGKPMSIAKIHHSEPSIALVGRVAGGVIGAIGRLGSGGKTDLHFTLVVSDAYSGIYAIDGQPTYDASFSLRNASKTLDNMLLIRTNIYRNELPKKIKISLDIAPPKGMNRTVFAQKLVTNAHNFASYVVDYSAPDKLVGATMVQGEYNSSSYIAGLLNSVMGYVPKIETPGYQTPGWDMPIPASYFKGEALR